MTSVYMQGLLTGGSLIIAIGAQNAYVLSQGIKKQHYLLIPLICSIIDTVLIFVGVTGLGIIIEKFPSLLSIVKWGGATFLFVYGLLSWRNAFARKALKVQEYAQKSRLTTAGQVLAISLLNPHLYLDTVFLLGSIASQHAGASRYVFGSGAAAASWLWFFTLSLTGRSLSGLFQNPRLWQILDVVIGIVMWSIAVKLIMP